MCERRHYVHRAIVSRGELPFRSLRSHGIQAASGAHTSAGTRDLEKRVNLILLSSRFLRQGRLTGRPKCARASHEGLWKREASHALLHTHPRKLHTWYVRMDQFLQVQKPIYHFHDCTVQTQRRHAVTNSND